MINFRAPWLIRLLLVLIFSRFVWWRCLLSELVHWCCFDWTSRSSLVLAVILLSKGREVNLRLLHPLDETALSRVIRAALVEFGADRPGFAWQDPELDAMSETYAAPGWIYFVVVEDGNVLGGAGIGPLSGVDATCEDRKSVV